MASIVTEQSAPAAPLVPEQIVWDLADLYPSVEAWRVAREDVAGRAEDLARFRGTLGESAEQLADALDSVRGVEKELVRLFVYAFLKADEDRRVSEAQERRGEAATLMAEFEEAVAFIAPELLRIGAATIERFIAAEPRLEKHAFGLRDTLRRADHTLSDESEEVLAATGSMRQGPERFYAMLSSSDLPFPTVTLSTGEAVRLDQAAYGRHRASPVREDRKLVFDAFWGAWRNYEATLGQTLETHVKSNVFEAKVRNFDSALDRALFGANIPPAVYRTLIEATHRHLPSLHRYFRIRRQLLGVDELRYSDIYPPLVSSDRVYTLEEARGLALASASPLGADYVTLLGEGLASDWTHVYPQPGKAPGAYMYGSVYDVHPYLLLNFNGAYDDVTTFVHEWGHAVHTMLSTRANPYETAGYATFTAEVASTTNEVLLQEHLLAQDLPDEERLFYLGSALEGIRGTFFRQVMFAEFELAIHEQVEQGKALSGARLSELYERLVRQYHGSDEGALAYDTDYAIEWAFIPHFYRNFYVFQYATSIAGGTMFADRLLTGDEMSRGAARRDYLAVLSAGGSDYAYDLLRNAGIDLATDAPCDALIARMNRVMDEIEAILGRRG